MKTLAVYYSKTGNTKKVAEAVIKNLNCDFDELKYDEETRSIQSAHNPSDYDRIILLSPIWAFSLAEPMKLYLARFKSEINTYHLIVTCGRFGLRGCIRNCKSAIGKPPVKAVKFRSTQVEQGEFDVTSAL